MLPYPDPLPQRGCAGGSFACCLDQASDNCSLSLQFFQSANTTASFTSGENCRPSCVFITPLCSVICAFRLNDLFLSHQLPELQAFLLWSQKKSMSLPSPPPQLPSKVKSKQQGPEQSCFMDRFMQPKAMKLLLTSLRNKNSEEYHINGSHPAYLIPGGDLFFFF